MIVAGKYLLILTFNHCRYNDATNDVKEHPYLAVNNQNPTHKMCKHAKLSELRTSIDRYKLQVIVATPGSGSDWMRIMLSILTGDHVYQNQCYVIHTTVKHNQAVFAV